MNIQVGLNSVKPDDPDSVFPWGIPRGVSPSRRAALCHDHPCTPSCGTPGTLPANWSLLRQTQAAGRKTDPKVGLSDPLSLQGRYAALPCASSWHSGRSPNSQDLPRACSWHIRLGQGGSLTLAGIPLRRMRSAMTGCTCGDESACLSCRNTRLGAILPSNSREIRDPAAVCVGHSTGTGNVLFVLPVSRMQTVCQGKAALGRTQGIPA